MRFVFLIFAVFVVLMSFGAPVFARGTDDPFRSTPYPLPRFVSMASSEAYVRAGPGRQYPVKWVFKRAAMPVEIILEFEHWRKVRDVDGGVGWVHKSLLSGRRSAFVRGDDLMPLFKNPEEGTAVKAYVQPGAVLRIRSCGRVWCNVDLQEYRGWIAKENLWGVYKDELIDP